MNFAPIHVDGVILTDSDAEAWLERWSICVCQGDITEDEAKMVANDSVRRMRA